MILITDLAVIFFLHFIGTGVGTSSFNPRPPEVFFVTYPPKGVVATPSLDFLYGMPDTPIFATTSV